MIIAFFFNVWQLLTFDPLLTVLLVVYAICIYALIGWQRDAKRAAQYIQQLEARNGFHYTKPWHAQRYEPGTTCCAPRRDDDDGTNQDRRCS